MMKISVVIPFYNLSRYVRPCIESVRAAFARAGGGVALDVVCVDDGSTDETGRLLDEITAEAAAPDLSIRVVHKANGGEGSARNAGLAVATGEWVTFLDADDLWLSNILTSFVGACERNADAEIVSFGLTWFEDGTPPPNGEDGPSSSRPFDIVRAIPSDVAFAVGIAPTFFRRELVQGLRFNTLPLGADRVYVAQCLVRASCVVVSDVKVYAYRRRSGSMSSLRWDARKVESLIDYASESIRIFAESGKKVGRRWREYLANVLLKVAKRHLRNLPESDRVRLLPRWRTACGAIPAADMPLASRLIRRFGIICGHG